MSVRGFFSFGRVLTGFKNLIHEMTGVDSSTENYLTSGITLHGLYGY